MSDIVQKLWGFCHTLRHDGIDYGDYIEQLTYLLFLKMADEKGVAIPKGCDWSSLKARSGTDLTESPSRSMGYLLASAFYEFSHGTIVPYAVGGVGLYVVDPPYGSRTVRVGAHAGAGVAFYFRRRIALTGEVLVHGLGSVEGLTSSFVTTNAGIRYYF